MSANGGSSGVRPAAAAVGAVVIAVVSGIVGWKVRDGAAGGEVEAGRRAAARPGSLEIEAPVAATRVAALEQERAALAKRVEALEAEAAALSKGKVDLEKGLDDATRKAAAATKELAAAKDDLAKAKAAATPAPAERGPGAKRLLVDFGEWSKLPVVAEADWKEMGEAVKNMTGLIGDMIAKGKAGEEVPREIQAQVFLENQKLAKFAVTANGKLPTHAFGNGEYTHPVVLANLMASHLKLVGLPLTEAQVADIATLGEEYDFEWERLQAGYGEAATVLEKILDELELKRRVVDRMLAALGPEQRAVVAPPATHHLMGIDLYSPVLLLGGCASAVPGPTREAIRDGVVAAAVNAWSVPVDRRDALVPIADRWLAEAAPKLEPVGQDEVQFFHIDQGIAAGRAFVKAKRDAATALGLDAEAWKKLAEQPWMPVPRMLKP